MQKREKTGQITELSDTHKHQIKTHETVAESPPSLVFR